MKKILLVGCGNIGSRHLQAILKLKTSLDITILEPSEKSVKRCSKLIDEVKFGGKHQIFWKKSLSDINKIYHLCIISTNSDIRFSLISKLIKKKNKKFLVEKMVCQSKNEYSKLLLLSKKNNVSCWINTSRRLFDFYKKIKNQKTPNSLILNISGGNFGLGSNAIHFLDLFCWLCNSNKLKLDGSNLSKKIIHSKRGNNFYEFTGMIHGTIDNKFFINITSLPNSTSDIRLNFIENKSQIFVNETEQFAYKFNNKNNTKLTFTKEFTSNTTTKIVSDILYKNKCELPLLDFLSIPHNELFRIFNSHIYKITKQKLLKCPIT